MKLKKDSEYILQKFNTRNVLVSLTLRECFKKKSKEQEKDKVCFEKGLNVWKAYNVSFEKNRTQLVDSL